MTPRAPLLALALFALPTLASAQAAPAPAEGASAHLPSAAQIPDPPSRPYTPPAPPARPDPPVGRQMGQRIGFRPGLLLSAGWQRDLSMGAELQLRLARNLGLGFGGQMGMALGEELICPTYGGTTRLYVGGRQRFVVEGGFAKNRIDPTLSNTSDITCDSGEINYGPEASFGFQAVTPGGFVVEALGGMAFILNDALARRHGSVAPIVQFKLGYLID